MIIIYFFIEDFIVRRFNTKFSIENLQVSKLRLTVEIFFVVIFCMNIKMKKLKDF